MADRKLWKNRNKSSFVVCLVGWKVMLLSLSPYFSEVIEKGDDNLWEQGSFITL